MFGLTTSFVLATLTLSAVARTGHANKRHANAGHLNRRQEVGEDVPLIGCPTPENTTCKCPTDTTGDAFGALLNVYPGYQCAYVVGDCTYSSKNGELWESTSGANCVSPGPACGPKGCQCPLDNDQNYGEIVNETAGYQCAYGQGACTWGMDGILTNKLQTNCPEKAPCTV